MHNEDGSCGEKVRSGQGWVQGSKDKEVLSKQVCDVDKCRPYGFT